MRRSCHEMLASHRLAGRLGLSVPYEWWPSPALLASLEAAGNSWVQAPTPPASILADPRSCIAHARGLRAALATTRLRLVLHAPGSLVAGSPAADRALQGAVSYGAECGAEILVYHARAIEDRPSARDRLLAEAASLAALAPTLERLGITLALENLAPLFPGPETASANPLAVRSLVRGIGSPAIGLCLDVGHANVVAGLRRTSLARMVEPVLDAVILFHLHDNLGARWRASDERPDLDPLRLDLHLPPGEGTLPWHEVAESLLAHAAPLLLEVHPPRPAPSEIAASFHAVLRAPAPPASPRPSPAAI